MPIYEYQCQACGKEMEISQRITEPALTECPECQAPKLQRLISATSFQLKGGGWYRDGYGAGKGKQRSENDRIDRVSKALNADKEKSASSGDAGGGESKAAPASTSSGSEGGGGGGGGGESKAT